VINREVGLNCRTPGSRPFSAAMTILIAEQRAHFVLWVQWRFGPRRHALTLESGTEHISARLS
jgi:hypothetical protein